MISVDDVKCRTSVFTSGHTEKQTVYAAKRRGTRKKAFYYERKHWNHVNHKYGFGFSSDCTNYASQIMNVKYKRSKNLRKNRDVLILPRHGIYIITFIFISIQVVGRR
ncbi:amidase domain-containing protein [Dellaglioa sp. BT-FLS60]